MKTLIMFISLLTSMWSFAQADIDTLFSGKVGDPAKTLKEDSSGIYYVSDTDTTKIIFYSNKLSLYKIYNKTYNLLLEGQITERVCSQLVFKGGKWVSYYGNGKTKTSGYYYRNQPVGNWNFYYPNGNLLKSYTLSLIEIDSMTEICKVGLYEEFYENGRLKVSGIYKVKYDSTNNFLLYDSLGNSVVPKYSIKIPISKPLGTWKYFTSTGELQKQEIY